MSSGDDSPAEEPSAEGLPVAEADQPTDESQATSSTSGAATTDEEVTGEQVEATAQAAEAEGHAEGTAAGAGDGPDAEPEGEPVAEAMEAASEGVEPAGQAEAAEPAVEVDPTSPDSADELRLGLLATFKEELGDGVVGAHIRDGDDLWIRVTPETWREAAQIAKGLLGCTAFCFLSAIDWLPSPWGRSEDSPLDVPVPAEKRPPMAQGYAGGDTRFQVLARVQNPQRGYGLTIKADVPDPEAGVPSWIPVYAGANWHEREAWEMYGIFFVGHPHLVKLYLPGAFEGNPLRKDFPLLARLIKPWPGIVDVEPMPDEEDADTEAESTTEEVSP
ncbi:MAG: NADH-quinone oxidoreductase subunit C [Acidimicrobiales bacterium]